MNATEYTYGQVAHAAGITGTTLNKWSNEGLIPVVDRDATETGYGNARTLSYHTALAVIIMGALSRRNVPIKTASLAANAFAHSAFDGEREIGKIFESGLTFIVVFGDKKEPKYRLLNIDADKPFRDVWSELLPANEGAELTVVNVNDLLFMHVRGLSGTNADQFLENRAQEKAAS
jgi:hypothetical protein